MALITYHQTLITFVLFLYRIYPIFDEQITEIINRCKVTASIVCLTVQKSKRIVQKSGIILFISSFKTIFVLQK